MGKPRKSLEERQGELADLMPHAGGGFGRTTPKKLSFLEEVNTIIDWKAIRAILIEAYSDKGRPAIEPIVLYKMTLLQRWFNLSDPQCELQCQDRLSFQRFLGISPIAQVPDETTLVRFRARIAAHDLDGRLAYEIDEQLACQGLQAEGGQSVIVDGSLVASRTNRGTRDKNGDLVEPDAATQGRSDGKPPAHGYKMHAALDEESDLILGATGTPATGCEREQFLELIDEDDDEALADKGYPSQAVDDFLRALGVTNGVMRKKPRGGKLSEYERRRNLEISRRRIKIERIFSILKTRFGLNRLRWQGLEKARMFFRQTRVAYNLWVVGRRLSLIARAGP